MSQTAKQCASKTRTAYVKKGRKKRENERKLNEKRGRMTVSERAQKNRKRKTREN